MEKIEFAEITSMLDIIYGKLELDKATTELWYEFFKDYKKEDYLRGVKEYIANETFPPLPASLLKYVENAKVENRSVIRHRILQMMSADGYFKTEIELQKAQRYIEDGPIPEWFKDDMRKYNQLLVENKATLKLEG